MHDHLFYDENHFDSGKIEKLRQIPITDQHTINEMQGSLNIYRLNLK